MTTIYTFNNKVLKNSANDKWLTKKSVDPYNPLGLPPNTVRVRTSDGNVPTKGSYTTYDTATLVTGTTDVYDVYKSGTSFSSLLFGSNNVVEILGANTAGITNMSSMFNGCTYITSIALFDTSSVLDMSGMFYGCTFLTSGLPLFDTSNVTNMYAMLFNVMALTSVPLFDTSNVSNMKQMLFGCSSLTAIPLFDTSSVTNMDQMCAECFKVQSGALTLYNQVSTQATPPTGHNQTFYRCGRDTTTGAAELAQIPSSWGGTGA